MDKAKKRKSCVGCFGKFILLLAIVFILSLWRESLSAVSPDGKFTAQITKPNLFEELFQDSKIRLELVQNATGQRVVVERQDSGGLMGDTVTPVALIWHHDNQRFAYISEVMPAHGWPQVDAYRVQLSPLKLYYEENENWLKSTVALNTKSQDKVLREQAEKLSKYMHKYYKSTP